MKTYWKPTHKFFDSPKFEKTAVVLHKTLGKMPGVLNWLVNDNRGGSAHALATRKGVIWEMVKDEDGAWHAGHVIYNPTALGKTVLQNDPTGQREHLNANFYTYGLECEALASQNWTEKQMEAIVWWCKKKGVGENLALITHHDFVPWKPKMDNWRQEVLRRINDGLDSPPDTPKNETLIKSLRLQIQNLMNQIIQILTAQLKAKQKGR